ncbi:hypothetical protein PUN28_018257 [Cardiocondyla obscurior]|uniref:Release factor glutamine methyltransferase N-terminal domain-containing protein n=1 Tax=Cardiocondyla obscurior TaxID=286306 RepID=A0AAW2EKH3_9HYME
MWCRNILKTNTCSKSSVFGYLQCLTNNNYNVITLAHSARLFVTNAQTIGNIIDQWGGRFESEGIPKPMDKIKHIVAHVTGTKKINDVLNIKSTSLDTNQIERLESLCKCVLSRMPLQYLLGEWPFHDITLKLVPPIFVPWQETEVFVSNVLKRLSQLTSQADSYEMLEIGSGSGCITLAIAHGCKKLKCIAFDANPNACDLTVINRNKLNLRDRVKIINATLKPDSTVEVSNNWNDTVDVNLNTKLFDFVVSNPPYVPRSIHPKLLPEIRLHNDFMAFDGGDDGLKVITPVIRYASKVLKTGGYLFMEVHNSHPELIESFTKKNPDLKLKFMDTYRDFCVDGYTIELMKVE